MGGKGHKPNCGCPWCRRRIDSMGKNEFEYSLRNWSKSKCEDALASLRYSILARVSQLSRYWEGLCEMNKKKEKIQERLEELGMRIKDQ